MQGKRAALLVVDIQNDFLPGGALAVPEGDQVVTPANALMDDFRVVVGTQDWHPANHGSFSSQHPGHKPGDVIDLDGIEQILWPVHCVQGTHGAEFANTLRYTRFERVFQKGIDPRIDSYSAFFDNAHRRDTGLERYLRARNVGMVHIAGLATDYCVLYTARDAVELGFEVVVHSEACRGVNLKPKDSEKALKEMAGLGARIV